MACDPNWRSGRFTARRPPLLETCREMSSIRRHKSAGKQPPDQFVSERGCMFCGNPTVSIRLVLNIPTGTETCGYICTACDEEWEAAKQEPRSKYLEPFAQ